GPCAAPPSAIAPGLGPGKTRIRRRAGRRSPVHKSARRATAAGAAMLARSWRVLPVHGLGDAAGFVDVTDVAVDAQVFDGAQVLQHLGLEVGLFPARLLHDR